MVSKNGIIVVINKIHCRSLEGDNGKNIKKIKYMKQMVKTTYQIIFIQIYMDHSRREQRIPGVYHYETVGMKTSIKMLLPHSL